jgi:hypothetical protein
VLKFQRRVVGLAGIVLTVGMGWYFWSENEGPSARVVAGATLVSYDPQTMQLTAIVNIQNSGDRPTVASITNAVFVDSQKQAPNYRTRPLPWRTDLTPKQSSPVVFILEGERATSVWNGAQLMEVTLNADYDGNAKLHCSFSFMGRFYPEAKRIGTVSSVTSPGECRRLR